MRIPSGNKKRRKFLKEVYAYETFKVTNIPKELEYRIQNSKEQKLQTFDFFISHSSKDHKEVQRLITHLNNTKKNIYCDWINDSDYLKRNLVGSATKTIIEKRIDQSNNILLIKSANSQSSIWVKYELNYAHSKGKSIKSIDIQEVEIDNYNLTPIEFGFFLDSDFSNYNLFNVISQQST